MRSTVLKCLLLFMLVRKCLKTTDTDKNERGVKKNKGMEPAHLVQSQD